MVEIKREQFAFGAQKGGSSHLGLKAGKKKKTTEIPPLQTKGALKETKSKEGKSATNVTGLLQIEDGHNSLSLQQRKSLTRQPLLGTTIRSWELKTLLFKGPVGED